MAIPDNKFMKENAERTYREAISMSVFCHMHSLAPLRNILKKQNVIRSSSLRKMEAGSRVRVSGMSVIFHTPPTKSGKRVMFLTLEDETGLLDIVVFPKTQEKFARIILTSEILTLEGKLQRRGVNGKAVSIIMQRAVVGLCGPLTKLLGYVTQNRSEGKKWMARTPVLTRALVDCEDTEHVEQLALGF